MEDQNKYFWRGGELEDIKIAYKAIKRIMEIEKKKQDNSFKVVKNYLANIIADSI